MLGIIQNQKEKRRKGEKEKMTETERKKAIQLIKSECYVFNPMNFDRTIMINSALDCAIEALKLYKGENYEKTHIH